MPINVLVNGGFGRMGQLTVKAITEDPRFTLVGQIGKEYNLKEAIKDSKAQVVVDFTHPEAVFNNTKQIIEAGVHPVIGTSGLTLAQIELLKKECEARKLGGIIAPNFSLGAMLMIKHAREIAKYMPQAEIIEMHHPTKADSPSGTSIYSAEMIAEEINQADQSKTPDRETVKGARGASHKGIHIHAVRLPGFLAHQQIIFGSIGETLTLRHDSIDRQCFVPGICLACIKVMQLDQLVYGLEKIL